jgi:uncharacterized sulfatase
VDLYPTLADLCGLPPPVDLEGSSFKPLLSDPTRPGKQSVFTVVSRPREKLQPGDPKFGDITSVGRTVFDGRWRYTVWPDGSEELYDHHHDPLEYENLAAEPNQRGQLAVMKRRMANGWRSSMPP